MKKILITMLLLCGIVGQVKAQEEYDFEDGWGWLVVKDGVTIEEPNGEYASFSDIYWECSNILPKGTLKPGGEEYMFVYDENGEHREPKYPDGYIYYQSDYAGTCYRIKKDGLIKVQLSSYIPLKYGNGKAHKGENGMSFKIVPFKSSAKVKVENYGNEVERSFKRFIKSQKCYLLMIMTSTGKVEHVELLEKTSKGFKNAHREYHYFSQKEPKVNAQGLLTTQWRMAMGDSEEDDFIYWTWVKGVNALVGVSEDGAIPEYLIPFLKVAK